MDLFALHSELVELDPGQLPGIACDDQDVALDKMIELKAIAADIHALIFRSSGLLLDADGSLTFQGFQVVSVVGANHVSLDVSGFEVEGLLGVGVRCARRLQP